MLSLLERVWSGESVQVRTMDNPPRRFTIVSKEFAGVKGFGCIPDGKKRVRRSEGHRIMSKEEVQLWLESLREFIPLHVRLDARPNKTHLMGIYQWECDTKAGILIFNSPTESDEWVYGRFVDVARANEFYGRMDYGFNNYSGKFNQPDEETFISSLRRVLPE